MNEHPVFTEMILKIQLAERLAYAERHRRVALAVKAADRRTGGVARRLRVQTGRWLVALGQRLQSQSDTCAASGHPADASRS